MDSILSQFNPVHTLAPIYLTIIFMLPSHVCTFYPQEFSINTLYGCLVPYEQDIQVACYIYLDLILMSIQCHQRLYQQINKLKFSLLVEFQSWDIAETKGKWGS
jgi:hypothetical protein